MTERLLLRPFTLDDAPTVQRLAGHKDIAKTTLNIPHLYEDGMAEEWINTHKPRFEKGEGVTFAVVSREKRELVGAISLMVNNRFESAEMGYWLGRPYWNKGYCTEAARELLHYGFNELGLNRIFAAHIPGNPASDRVMEKIGMTYEGCHRQAVKKGDKFSDLTLYAILKSEFKTGSGGS